MQRMTIDRLIIDSPCEEPAQHWGYERETRTFDLAGGRRSVGYVVTSDDSKAFDHPGVISITRRLLDHWRDPEEFHQPGFFFCQLKGVETLIWLAGNCWASIGSI